MSSKRGPKAVIPGRPAGGSIRRMICGALDFVKASLTAKSIGDFMVLQSEFARKQTDAVVVQFQDLAELAKKAVVETLEPIKDQLAKSFKIAV